MLSILNAGRLFVRLSAFFSDHLADPPRCSGPEEAPGGGALEVLDAPFLTNMLAAVHDAKRPACSEQTQCELAPGRCDLADPKETDRGPASGDCMFANIWYVCMY